MTGYATDLLTIALVGSDLPLQGWSVTAPEGAAAVTVVLTYAMEGGVALRVHPELTPGATYLVVGQGAADVAVDPLLAPVSHPGFPRHPMAALTNAYGAELDDLAGAPATILLKDVTPGEHTVVVESTLRFPVPGAVWLGPYRVAYGSVTDGALHECAWPDHAYRTVAAGAPVLLDGAAVAVAPSRVEHARRETLIHRCPDSAIDGLAALHGVPRPPGYPRGGWRDVLRAVAYGRRGVPGTMFAAVRAALAHRETGYPVVLDPGAGSALLRQDGADAWAPTLAGRWVIVDGHVLLICEVDEDHLYMAPTSNAWWSAPWWATAEATVNATALVLPFRLHERVPSPGSHDEPGVLELVLYEDAVGTPPPTYLLDVGEQRPTGQPFGGHLLQSAVNNAGHPLGQGPHPPYLFGEELVAGPLATVLSSMLPPGYRVVTRLGTPGQV